MRDRGTSVVELLVVLALITVMVMVAADLVVHSVGAIETTGRAVRNPTVVHVIAQLRRDVETARRVDAGPAAVAWTTGVLDLEAQDGTVVRYQVDDGLLIRAQGRSMEAWDDQRRLMNDVTSWWWRMPSPGVVDLRIGHLASPQPELQAGRPVAAGRARQTERLRFAIRLVGGGGGW